MKTKKNVTGINTRITEIADTIQNARKILSSDNPELCLCSDDTRKLILICLIFLRTGDTAFVHDSINLKNILTHLNISDIDVFGLYDNDKVQVAELTGALAELSRICQYPDWSYLINYALEVLEYDVEVYFNVKVSRGIRSANSKKKENGIYYTPVDVVEFIVSRCIDSILHITDKPSVLDCSCGSGIFLLQSLKYLENKKNPEHNIDVSLHTLEKCIWGIDVSQAAVDCCKSVLLQYYLNSYESAVARLNEIWNIINKTVYVGDATCIQEVLAHNPAMPLHFDCIVGNPPYVSIGRKSNLFIPFVENMITYSSECSCAALILPLSICYSQGSDFIRLRNKIQEDSAVWTFMNYDRSPDSLFGDQIKTRNTILFRQNIESTTDIFTTNLQRWTSTNRKSLFTNCTLCKISGMSISKFVPKISCNIEKIGYEHIISGTSNLRLLFERDDSNYPLVVNGTAYNWLCAYDHIPPSTDENEKTYISGTTRIYYLPDKDSRDFCIAILSNRIAYWFWNVIGDGFHFNATFLSDFRVGKDNFTKSQYAELCRLGRLYSEQVKRCPTISCNAGKKIVNYSHWEALDTVRSIEKIIINALNLPDEFASHIEYWYFNQVHCNRDNEKR